MRNDQEFLRLAVLYKNTRDDRNKLALKPELNKIMDTFLQKMEGKPEVEIYGFEILKLFGEPNEIAAVQKELREHGFNV